MSFRYSGNELILDEPKKEKTMSFNEALKKCLNCKPVKKAANKKRSKHTFSEWLDIVQKENKPK